MYGIRSSLNLDKNISIDYDSKQNFMKQEQALNDNRAKLTEENEKKMSDSE